MPNSPTVSVVMSVFNGEPFLAEAIESILNQTFRDFEFIIIDDGSTDGTAEILSRYEKLDARVLVHHQANQGQVPSLNTGCRLARGRYIARIDADDIALPERFQRQIDFLEHNPQVALVGSWVDFIDASRRPLPAVQFPSDDKIIREWLFELRHVPFSHPTWLLRADAFRAVNGYRTAFAPAEDYDFLVRIAERWQVGNLPIPLLRMRRHGRSLSITNSRQQVTSILVAWTASEMRRAGEPDPTSQGPEVTRELLRTLGVSDAIFEAHLMGVYQYWIEVMLQSSDNAGALQVLREARESEAWKHINKSIVANTWLAAARLYSEQGRYLQSATCAARAFAVRPIIAGRPIKRIASRLGLGN